jgi:predicted secreted protein
MEALALKVAVWWPIVSAVLNVVLRTKTPEQWVERCEKHPRFAAFTRLMRSVGVDPVKMVQAIGEFTNGGKT